MVHTALSKIYLDFAGNEHTRIYFYRIRAAHLYERWYVETQSFRVMYSVNVSTAIYPQIGEPTFVPANNGVTNNHVRSE